MGVDMTDWVALLAALVAGTLGLAGVVLGATAQRGLAAEAHQREAEIEHYRRQLDQAERSRVLVDRYQEPLVRAAYDLQSRLWNILRGDLLTVYGGDQSSPRWGYARQSTAWLFGQYFGWVEILRREAQFLSLSDEDARRSLATALSRVAHVCSSDRPALGPELQILRAQQRAMGELMIVGGNDAEGRARTDCMGYAAFTRTLADRSGELSTWFGPLLHSIDRLATTQRGHRMLELQHALIDLIDQLDPAQVRFPEFREKA